MISLVQPLALVGGGLLAVFVVALHFFAPRPPDRTPLPTARFLREDTHTTLRFRRRPTDVTAMALRAVLALLLGLMFAQPRWLPQRTDGVTRVVLLDRGAGMASVWGAAQAAALSETEAEGAQVVTFSDGPPTPVDAAALPQLVPDESESSYLNGIRALRTIATEVSSREVEAVLITRGRWSAWDPQFAGLRDAAWPGGLEVVWLNGPGPEGSFSDAVEGPPVGGLLEAEVSDSLGAGVGDPPEAPDRGPQPLRPVPGPLEPSLVPALHTLGYEVVVRPTSNPDRPASLEADGGSESQGLLRFVRSQEANGDDISAARRGDTVVVYGPSTPERAPDEVRGAWDPDGWPSSPHPEALRVRDRRLPFADVGFAAGSAVTRNADAAYLPIVLEDGAPVAVGEAVGSGCVVRFGGPIDVGSGHPAYPHLIRTLADGCRGPAATRLATGPLDGAALSVMEGAGSSRVDVTALGLDNGTALSGWVLLLVLGAALAETLWVRRAQDGPGGPRPTEARA